MPEFRAEVVHYGEPTEYVITASFTCSGPKQIELIQPLGGTSVYGDYLKDHPEGGLQHLASWCADVDARQVSLTDEGVDYVLAQRYPNSHAYLDMAKSLGVMIQLLPHRELTMQFFDLIEKAADNWDGKTDPVRIRE